MFGDTGQGDDMDDVFSSFFSGGMDDLDDFMMNLEADDFKSIFRNLGRNYKMPGGGAKMGRA